MGYLERYLAKEEGDVLDLMKRAKPLNDLHVLILLTVLTLLVMFIPPLKGTPPRIVLGLFMLLFGVGYSVIAALFPRKEDLDGIERFVLSIGLSIAVMSLIGLGLNFSSFGIRLIPILLSVSSLAIALSLVAGFRRASLDEGDRFGVTPGDIFKHLNHWFTTLSEESISLKLIAAISFSFIIFALYLIKSAPATGYELSIYESTPTLVWVFLIAGFIGGLSIIIHQAFTESKSNYWLIGLFILILTNFVILSLHALRGYLFYASTDHQSQIREILYIISTGHFANDLHPALVIYGSQISDICGIRPELVGRYLPPCLSVFFMMACMYLFAREVLPMKSQILVAAVASFTPFFNSLHVQVYPHAFAVLLFPLILYLYFKIMNRDSWEFRLLFIIFLILLPYSHPSAEVTLIFLFVIMELGRIIYEKRVYGHERPVKIMLTPVIISSITFFMWISSFAFFGSTLRSMYSSLFEPAKANAVTETVAVMNRLEWADIIEYVLKMYGDSLSYIIIIGVSGAIIVKRIFKKKEGTKYLLMLFLFCLMSIFVEYLLGVGVQFVKMGRLLNLLYMLTVAPIFVGFLLCELSRNRKGTKAIITVGLILILTAGVGTFTVYHSSWIFSPSWHITNMDVKGSDWFSEHRNTSLKFDAMGVDPSLMLGTVGLIPMHFNYTQHSTLGESLAHDSYAAINKRCKVANADPMMTKARLSMRSGWGFNGEDFDKLEGDQNVAKLYSNGEFDVFFIKSDTREVPER